MVDPGVESGEHLRYDECGGYMSTIAAHFVMIALISGGAVRPGPQATKLTTQPNVLIDEVMKVSGLDRIVEQIPMALAAHFASGNQAAQGDPEFVDLTQRVFQRAYAAETILHSITSYLARHYDQARLHAVIDLHKNDLARRFTEMEVEASGPAAVVGLQNFVAELGQTLIPPERVLAVRKLDEFSGASQLQAEIQYAINFSFSHAVRSILPPESQVSLEELDQRLSAMREQLAMELGQQTMIAMLFTYRDASLEELGAYLELLETDVGAWWIKVTSAAIKESLAQAGDNAAEDFIREVERLRLRALEGTGP